MQLLLLMLMQELRTALCVFHINANVSLWNVRYNVLRGCNATIRQVCFSIAITIVFISYYVYCLLVLPWPACVAYI